MMATPQDKHDYLHTEGPRTADELIRRESALKAQIAAVELACKSAIARLTEELEAVTDLKLAIWQEEIEAFDRERMVA